MSKWCMFLLVLALVVATSCARNMPGNDEDAGVKDQKNFLGYNDLGGYSGIGDNGFLPIGGGIGGGMDGFGSGSGGLGGFGDPAIFGGFGGPILGGGGLGGDGDFPHP